MQLTNLNHIKGLVCRDEGGREGGEVACCRKLHAAAAYGYLIGYFMDEPNHHNFCVDESIKIFCENYKI